MNIDEDHETKQVPSLKGNADYYTCHIYVRDLMHTLHALFVTT